jgi:hypothetical protein
MVQNGLSAGFETGPEALGEGSRKGVRWGP